MPFAGFVELEGTLVGTILSRSITGLPANADALPTYRIYGPSGLVANGSGTSSLLDTKAITNAADNGSGLIRITSASHGLTTGTRVTIESVGGVAAANGAWTITRIDANNFDLQGSTFSGTYTSGGVWNVSGLYKYEHSILSANGFESGQTYTVVGTWAVGGLSVTAEDKFTVV